MLEERRDLNAKLPGPGLPFQCRPVTSNNSGLLTATMNLTPGIDLERHPLTVALDALTAFESWWRGGRQ